ncbi:isoaspartyl peptidase/L-asparaginase family protein [Undibacterium umbellatum]|uniref:Isoaspartyl peptidase/L-asparaginase n=1 Tax=Undibacterium umbellatum TaxID=2762300 RepID=A0ABR6Z5I9_9BURK|nr:isoaspartyl peptidase/L-asparaginase [Undibacterium umbellatum]MBC3906995.1 isoaspartyl peptidase/L-asparaginase [Undibacterium umbellatum]
MGARAAMAIHGGAGTILRSTLSAEREAHYLSTLQAIVCAGSEVLAKGGSALDAVSLAVSLLEDCPMFNAGKGSVFTNAGTIEMDAAIMDGNTRRAGAVACVQHVRNPIQAARAIMEHSPHVLMVGQGAETFLRQHGLPFEDSAYFYTEERHAQLQRARLESGVLLDHDGANLLTSTSGKAVEPAPLDPDRKFGTVGAVALDLQGNLAAATSTGGMTNKLPGRVGDTPMLGAGCYADNQTAALSSTGTGEAFMRSLALYDIAAQMQYLGYSLEKAAHTVVMDKLPLVDGQGGIIGVDRLGNIVLPFNTEGMYRAWQRLGESPVSAIYTPGN